MKEAKYLDAEELQAIKNFIQKRGFKEIDLQYEILDHLACQVEDLMTQENLSFEKALLKAHAGYGVLGLSVFEDSIRKVLEKKYRQQIVAEWMRWTSLPYILLVLGFGAVLYQSSVWISIDWLAYGGGVMYFLSQVSIFFKFRKELKAYRNTLILKASMLYLVVLPTFFFNFLIRLPLLIGGVDPNGNLSLIPMVLVIFGLTFVFLLTVTYRIIQYSINRCVQFESEYGPF